MFKTIKCHYPLGRLSNKISPLSLSLFLLSQALFPIILFLLPLFFAFSLTLTLSLSFSSFLPFFPLLCPLFSSFNACGIKLPLFFQCTLLSFVHWYNQLHFLHTFYYFLGFFWHCICFIFHTFSLSLSIKLS